MPELSKQTKARFQHTNFQFQTIKGRYGEQIKQGDRVFVAWHASNQANGLSTGFGVFIGGDLYGGIFVEFDTEKAHYSKTYGVTRSKIQYICSLGSCPTQSSTYYLDGHPCKGDEEFITLESEYLKNHPSLP